MTLLGLSALVDCKPYVLPSYVSIISAIPAVPGEKKTITEISNIVGESSSSVGKKVMVLQKCGLVYRVFGGSRRYIFLTDVGKEFAKGLGEKK